MKKNIFIGLTFLILISNQLKSQTDTISYILVPDSLPSFVYGPDNYGRFMATNINYPFEARLNQLIEGKVYISFVVDSLGNIFNPVILKDIGGGCGQEAIRVIKLSSGLWTSGIDKGKKANVKMTMPIKFSCPNCTVFKSKNNYIEIKPTADFYYNLGVNELNASRFLISIFYFSQALEKNPKDIDALYNRAVAKLKNNNNKSACEDLYNAQSLGDKGSTILIDKNCK